MIANSGHDENGNYRNGKAGDQTGNEWEIRSWYNRPWDKVLRHPDAAVRDKIALLAEHAAANNHIGYDQNNRTSFWNELKNCGYDPANITNDCEADCSSGVAAIVKAVGYLIGDTGMQNVSADTYTGNEAANLKRAGFSVLSASKYLTSDAYLYRGDILLNERSHTAINVTNGSKSGGSDYSGRVDIEKGSKGETVKEVQRALNTLGFRDENGNKLDVDGDFGAHTDYAVKAFQDKYDLGPDGKMAANGITWKKIDELLSGSGGSGTSHSMVSRGSTGSDVKTLQSSLNSLGYKDWNGSALAVDGDFGSRTEYAVKNFQEDYGLSVDGICGPNTWAKIDALTSKGSDNYDIIVTTALNLRSGPGTNYSVIRVLSAGERHTVSRDNGDWIYLCDAGGWVYETYTKKA